MSAPDYSTEQLLGFKRIHDFADPQSELSKLEAIYLSALGDYRCPHCNLSPRVIPMTGTAWGLDHVHEPECIESDEP